LVLVVASAVGSELSLSFSDDMSQKGGVGTKLWIVYLDCTTAIRLSDTNTRFNPPNRAFLPSTQAGWVKLDVLMDKPVGSI